MNSHVPRMTRAANASRRIFAAGLFLAATALAAVTGTQAAKEGNWILNDLPAAQAEARNTGKPIFAVFRCEQ